MANVFRLNRKQLEVITGGDPQAIRVFEQFFAYLENLGTHAATHEPGGTDPLTVDAAAATGSLRTLGAGAAQAAAGNHAHFDDAEGDPEDTDATAAADGVSAKAARRDHRHHLGAHAATHEAGGADELDVAALGGFPGGATKFLREDGTWAAPTASGAWNKIANPGTDWLAIKNSGWTEDRFSVATGGFELDFSALVPAGTKAVRCYVQINTVAATLYSRPKGDPNISNTPVASLEWATRLIQLDAGRGCQAVIWLDSNCVAEFAINNVSADLYIAYPTEYML
jgi:hypothetical protein